MQNLQALAQLKSLKMQFQANPNDDKLKQKIEDFEQKLSSKPSKKKEEGSKQEPSDKPADASKTEALGETAAEKKS